jgi:two-component system sensor histidine kinase KdpD
VGGCALGRAANVLAGDRVAMDLAPDLPLAAIDVVLFEQALFNVLDNAAKYAPAGTTVTLRAWADAPGRELRLQVLDEGPGLATEVLPNVFEKFYRAPELDRRKAGTGLGLAIARGFVAAMGGRIEAANRTDARGAAFTFVLPMADAA